MVRIFFLRGIIPARAGFTICGVAVGCAGGDHPRSRGVYSLGSSTRAPPTGSSPLARGLRRWLNWPSPQWRIIPARAGFTWSPGTPLTMSPGSSPLARGLLLHFHSPDLAPRIIPARAGFTHELLPPSSRDQDHPRSRGVYRGVFNNDDCVTGSSPLARGLRGRRAGMRGGRRIIPARAGFTAAHSGGHAGQ